MSMIFTIAVVLCFPAFTLLLACCGASSNADARFATLDFRVRVSFAGTVGRFMLQGVVK